jgi:hypothetical protein
MGALSCGIEPSDGIARLYAPVRPGRRRKNYDDVRGLAMHFPPSSTKYQFQENRTMTSTTKARGIRIKSRIKVGLNFTKICF